MENRSFLVQILLPMMMIVIWMKMKILPMEMNSLDQFSPRIVKLVLYINVVDLVNI